MNHFFADFVVRREQKMSRRAVIVSTARTGLAKSFRGGFNKTHGAALAGHAIQNAISKAKIDPALVDDVILGCGMPEGETGMNVARNAALWAGCPVTTSGTTINRFCSSGLQAVASAAHSIIHDSVECAIGGGVDSISLVQPKMVKGVVTEKLLWKKYPALWMPMIETADIVAKRYGISRERQDEYSVESQRRTAAAQVIVPLRH
jgi:acetyl-CoA C-acetyltransferase